MKLFLTSTVFLNTDVTKKVFSKINKNIKDCKVLFIPNEKATYEKLDSNKYINRVINWGFSKENIYVFDERYIDKYKNLDIDILTISGGNTFATLKKIRDCKFDKVIIDYVKNGVIYIGGSCGSHIVTKNIKHVEKYDDNYVDLKDYSALDLFDGLLICHYNKQRKKDYEEIKEENVVKLSDEEVLYINEKDVLIY
ncbi:MAG: Type 1 glutamine amidotransferase-like domain-containing protein [Bacilli bacterium]|nr:Type 1 glutamine amidotransferase-like domain-containing protein [Bacilli bacterium]